MNFRKISAAAQPSKRRLLAQMALFELCRDPLPVGRRVTGSNTPRGFIFGFRTAGAVGAAG
jgi:hypothetical protein